jgi:hypothetical protein
VGTVGGLIALKGVLTRGVLGRTLRVIGLGLLARAAANVPPRRLVDLRTGARDIPVQTEADEAQEKVGQKAPADTEAVPVDELASSASAPKPSIKSTTKTRSSPRRRPRQ